MKKNYQILCILILLFSCTVQVQAQKQTYIGTVSEISALYKKEVKAKSEKKSAKAQIKHQLQGKSAVVLNLTTAWQEGNIESFYGEVENAKNSHFNLRIKENKVSGSIIMIDQKRYYQYVTAANDMVYLEEEDIDKVLCIGYGERNDPAPAPVRDPNMALAALPVLESLPGASAVVLLDFDGHLLEGTVWNYGYTNGEPIYAEPMWYTEAEIREIWKLISADYSPFELNITTSEEVFNRAPVNQRARVLFTPTNYFAPGWGGMAWIGSFNWGGADYGETPCFVWNTGVLYAGNTASHELGHMLYLLHDGRTSPLEEYYFGNDNWVPIMGGSFVHLAQWNNGDYPFANNQEDDLQIIASRNGFGYREDDHGNTPSTASRLNVEDDGNVSEYANVGNITASTDVDVFSFTTSGGNINLNITPKTFYSNLELIIYLRNSDNELIIEDQYGGSFFSINQVLQPGTYYLYIDGGTGLLGAYSDYGSLGEFSISGTVPVQNIAPVVSITSPVSGLYMKAPAAVTISADASDSDGSIAKMEFFSNNYKLGEDLAAPYTFSWEKIKAGKYQITAVATDNEGARANASIMLTVVNGYGNGNGNECELPAWNASLTYPSGALVYYNGSVYEAQTKSTGSTPASNSGSKDAWKYRGPCGKELTATAASNQTSIVEEIAIYPNPIKSKGKVNVKLPDKQQNVTVSLHDISSGGKMMEGQYQDVQTLQLQLAKVPHGYYVLKIIGDNQVWTRRLIINP